MSNKSSHLLEYKGYTVICENGMYKMPVNPSASYNSLQECKNEIDKIESVLSENLVNLKNIIRQKATTYDN
jgi:hypothetical protein